MSIPPKPLFRVTPCCVENGTSAEINLDGILASGTGVYTYNGASDLPIPGTDVTLVPGECYYIVPLGTLGIVTEVPLADLTFIDARRCGDPLLVGCPTCDPPGTFYIKAEPCCGGDPIFFKGEGYEGGTVTEPKEPTSGSLSGQWQATSPSIPQFSILDFNGVYLLDGPGIVEGLTIGQCYTFSYNTVEDAGSEVTPAEYLALDYPPYISELTFISKDDCDADADGDGEKDCPACEEICYRLTSCTGITVNTTADLSAYVGTYIEINELPGTFLVQVNEGLCENAIPVITYSGPAPEDCPCICYEVLDYQGAISYIDCDGVSQVTYGPDKFCAVAPPFIRGREGIDYTLITGTDCIDGECVPECYILTNCEPLEYPDQDPVLNSNLQSLSQYANGNSVVVLAGYEGCWTVTTATCQCITITINGQVIETTLGSDLNGRPTFSFEYNGTTYYIWYNGPDWFITATLGSIITEELMAAAEGTDLCPTGLAWTPSATNFPEITSLTTELCPEQCDCPVDVTVIQDYPDCSDCVGITAYKLRNCQKDNEVIYSIQDLSAYVGQVLKDDCACWIVEEIDYQPPSLTVIENPILYSECETCLATYYQLDNCDESGTPLQIITATNLFTYIGQTIKIEGCTGCFTVSEYAEETEPENSQDVTVVESFSNCPDCLEVTPRCSTVFNNSTEDRTFTYIDVNGYPQETEVVKSGHFSLRHCVQYWDEPDTFIYNYYGDCNLLDTEIIPTEDCSCFEVTIVPIDPVSGLPTTPIVTNATWNGSLFNGFKVYEVTIDSVLYYIWNSTTTWYITITVGTISPTAANLKGVTDCPAGDWNVDNTLLPDGRDIDTLTTVEIPCEPFPGKLGICPQYFPNNRKVRPGYNTPICSADKYDKITCKFAGIVYKKVLELRYGISNCCPEEDEKWLIKKELIELQALTDPNYTCDPLTDCCGKQTSDCSCNS